MFDLIFSLITSAFEFLYDWFNSLVYPWLDRLIYAVFPSGSNIWFYANEILTQFFFVGTQFIKMVFIHICGINIQVFQLVAGVFIVRIATYFSLRLIKFGLNLYSIIRIGGTKS